MSEMLKGIGLMGQILGGVGGNVKDVFAECNDASVQNIIFLGEIWYADYSIVDIVTVFMLSWNNESWSVGNRAVKVNFLLLSACSQGLRVGIYMNLVPVCKEK